MPEPPAVSQELSVFRVLGVSSYRFPHAEFMESQTWNSRSLAPFTILGFCFLRWIYQLIEKVLKKQVMILWERYKTISLLLGSENVPRSFHSQILLKSSVGGREIINVSFGYCESCYLVLALMRTETLQDLLTSVLDGNSHKRSFL